MKQPTLLHLLSMAFMLTIMITSCTPTIPTPEPTLEPPTATIAHTDTNTPLPTATPVLAPSGRAHVSIAYDSESDRIILYGGSRIAQTNASWGGTWAYDVKTNHWTEMNPEDEPGSRLWAGMAYDSESDRIILHGGINSTFPYGIQETWAYDYNTNTWTRMSKGDFSCYGENMVYDSESDRIVLFGGGLSNNRYFNQVHAYDFNSDTWTTIEEETPRLDRTFHGMAYDSESDRIIVWGGSRYDSSTWAYDLNSNTWEKMPTGEEPDARRFVSMTYDVVADRVIIIGGDSEEADQTWSYNYNTNTWTNLVPKINPGFLSAPGLVYNILAEKIILFGGLLNGMDFVSDTWEFDSSTNTWTQVVLQP